MKKKSQKSKKSSAQAKREQNKRGFTIPPKPWRAFTQFVEALEVRNGDGRVKVHVKNSEVAMIAFRLIRAYGVEKGWRLLWDPDCQTEEFWDRLERKLRQFELPERNCPPEH